MGQQRPRVLTPLHHRSLPYPLTPPPSEASTILMRNRITAMRQVLTRPQDSDFLNIPSTRLTYRPKGRQRHRRISSKAHFHLRRRATDDISSDGLSGSASSNASAFPTHGLPTGGAPGDVEFGGPGPSQAQLPSPVAKKGRTNTPWTPAEEQRLKAPREAGSSWSEIAKTFPARTEGSVKKHWYKDMHYADFAEDEVSSFSAALLQ